jgi:hypothetical protein
MADFSYKPKFVDIRVKRPGAKEPRHQETVKVACDHVGCPKEGGNKAPKTTGKGEYWSFCTEHAGEYNRRYDFFKDMSPGELAAHRRAEEIGHRPTWSFKATRGDRVSASRIKAAKTDDKFGLFGADTRAKAPRAAPKKTVGRIQGMALDVLGLEENATKEGIRLRYAELVKKYHPDSNGGDRSAEQQLQKVIRAFKTLKAAGLA